jgi:hypothetical protein
MHKFLWWAVALATALQGCAARGVRCDERLQAINPPAAAGTSAAPETAAPASPTPPSGVSR